jgi:hypothetical protein
MARPAINTSSATEIPMTHIAAAARQTTCAPRTGSAKTPTTIATTTSIGERRAMTLYGSLRTVQSIAQLQTDLVSRTSPTRYVPVTDAEQPESPGTTATWSGPARRRHIVVRRGNGPAP